jgi:hypothetical protein
MAKVIPEYKCRRCDKKFDSAIQEHPKGFGIDVCIMEAMGELSTTYPCVASWVLHKCTTEKGTGIADLIGGRDVK